MSSQGFYTSVPPPPGHPVDNPQLKLARRIQLLVGCLAVLARSQALETDQEVLVAGPPDEIVS